MKKSKIFQCLLLLTALTALAACTKDDPEPEAETAAEGTMIALVDKSEWISEAPAVYIYYGEITIHAIGSDDTAITIYLNNDDVGKYDISGVPTTFSINIGVFTPANAGPANPLYASTYVEQAVTGEVDITEIDQVNKTISGTFHYKAARMIPEVSEVEVKGGSFTKIFYSDVPGLPAGSSVSFDVNSLAFRPVQMAVVNSLDNLVLNVAGAGNKSLTLTIPASTTTGTFDLGPIGSSYSATYVSNSMTYESTSGTVTITEHDQEKKRIKGTFSFTAELFPQGGESIAVTEGSFIFSY